MTLDPIQFCNMTKQEQNRAILDLIDFKWDLNWIKEKFGEIPSGINYEQNILQILSDIQSENSPYFKARQDVNRDIRNNMAFIEDIAKDIPSNYDAKKWKEFDLTAKLKELMEIRQKNSKIEEAKQYISTYENKLKGYEADKEIAISAEEKNIANERESLKSSIERMKAEIIAAEDKLKGLDKTLEDKKKIVELEFANKVTALNESMGRAQEFANMQIIDCSELTNECDLAEEMKKYLNEYNRMKNYQDEIEKLKEVSEEYTRKIELARTLPGEILQTATIPIKGLTVENGVPLINGLPVSNLSEGQKLELCVDIVLSKPNNLKLILLDGVEKLSDDNRAKLYSKCKENGLQYIATRTTNDNEMIITEL